MEAGGSHDITDWAEGLSEIDKTKDWLEYLKYLIFPSKAQKEWLVAYRLRRRKFPVPRPLGWIEKGRRGSVKESLYLSEALGTGVLALKNWTHSQTSPW